MVRSVRHSFSRRVVGVFASLMMMASVVGGVGTSPAESQAAGVLFDLFDADAPSDDWQNTYLLSLLSHYVYDGNMPGSGDFEQRFEQAFTLNGLRGFEYIEDVPTDTQGMIVETDDAVIVVMRGTEGVADLARDATVGPEPDGTHTGFRGASKSVVSDVRAELSRRSGKQIWFTGHSLGGAVTQDLAYQLRDDFNISGVVTFGEPTVYTRALPIAFLLYINSQTLHDNTELWLNDHDPVPHAVNLIPGHVGGFARVGDEHHIRDGGNVGCSVNDSFPILYLASDLADHDTRRYSTRILNLMPASQREEFRIFTTSPPGGLENPPVPGHRVADCDENPLSDVDPTVTANVSGTLGNNGWYRSDVTVTWSTEDIPAGTPSQGCQTSTVRIDTTGRTIVCRYTLSGGQVAEGRVTIKRDTTAPEASVQMARSANTYGWYTSPVDYSTVGTDSTSGVRSCSSARTYSGPDLASKLLIGVCHDQAGNRDFGYTRIKYDATAPTIKITTPKNGTSYRYGQNLVADYSCSDSVGVTSCSGPVADGKAISTTSTGKKSFKVRARDAAGNTRSVSHSYTVSYK